MTAYSRPEGEVEVTCSYTTKRIKRWAVGHTFCCDGLRYRIFTDHRMGELWTLTHGWKVAIGATNCPSMQMESVIFHSTYISTLHG